MKKLERTVKQTEQFQRYSQYGRYKALLTHVHQITFGCSKLPLCVRKELLDFIKSLERQDDMIRKHMRFKPTEKEKIVKRRD